MSDQGQKSAGAWTPNPYVGPRSFLRGERLYGRDYAQRHLLDLLIIVNDQPNAGTNLPLARQWIEEMRQELTAPATPRP